MVVTDFDIIIAGAGPAGLAVAKEVAKELGKGHRILVIDPKLKPETTAAWYSYADRIKANGLGSCVLHRCKSLMYVAMDLTHEMKDLLVVLDANKVLGLWQRQAKSCGVQFVQDTLRDAEQIAYGVSVKTAKSSYTARLLIDCTGITSPLLKKYNLVSHVNTWVLYGGVITHITIKDPSRIYFLPLNDTHNTYIGIYPHSAHKADFYVFYNLNESIGNPTDLKPLFESSFKSHYPHARIAAPLFGRIAGGELNAYALDNMVFFGQSGMMDPPGCGMGFNEILLHHQAFARNIALCLKNNQLDAYALDAVATSFRDPAIFQFQQIIAKYTYYFIFSPTKWRGGVAWLNSLGKDSRHWMRNEFSISWIKQASLKLYNTIPLSEVIQLMPPKDYAYIIEHFLKFVGNAVVEESERIEKTYKKGLIGQ